MPGTDVYRDGIVESKEGRPVGGEDRDLSFDQIKEKYQLRIYNLILRMIGNENPDDAEDLTVETFVNAWRAWGKFRRDAQVYTWLYQIACNLCKNWYKQKGRQREREGYSLDNTLDSESGELSREVPDWRNAPEKLLLETEFGQKIRDAVEALPSEYREVLILDLWEDLPYEEIAAILGLSVPAVKTRLHRARNKIRQRLEPYYRGWLRREEL
ncbi:sigma-70 family RNA polymerase sigma factor [Armatimonas sp.]|uniref:sigma-70 family RNA polymerase sigma factor n=1 Tax=Armatimonas sp. TaxID=1872638 RepID=UPI003753C371